MKKASLSVARRYARALLDVALEKGVADRLEPSLRAAAELFTRQADLQRALTHPAVSSEKKKRIVETVWKDETELVRRFLVLLVDRARIEALPATHQAYLDLWNDHRGVVSAQAISATPLTEAQRKALTDSAKKVAGRDVDLTTTVDAALLGGVVVRMNGRTYDGSIRAQLRALRTRLAPGAAPSSSSNPRV